MYSHVSNVNIDVLASSHLSSEHCLNFINCRSDCSLNGFCLAAFNAMDMIKHDKEVDIYQTVLNIRKSKTDLFNSMVSNILRIIEAAA